MASRGFIPGIPTNALPFGGGALSPVACVEHRTIGRWGGDYSVLSRRYVPSVQFLVGQDWGQWVQFYSIYTKCAHAAGANSWSVGIEFSGQNGEPLTFWQLIAGAHIHAFLIAHGIKPVFLSDGKVSWFNGFLNHSNVATNYAVRTDHITRDEFNTMVKGAQFAPAAGDEDDVNADQNAWLQRIYQRVEGGAEGYGIDPLDKKIVAAVDYILKPKVAEIIAAVKTAQSGTVVLSAADYDAIAERIGDLLAARLKD